MEINTTSPTREIASVVARYPAIAGAHLFGSHASGRATAHSDIDVALVGSAEELGPVKLDLLADLTAEGIDRVDLVLLDQADLSLRFEGVSPSCLVYAKDNFGEEAWHHRAGPGHPGPLP